MRVTSRTSVRRYMRRRFNAVGLPIALVLGLLATLPIAIAIPFVAVLVAGLLLLLGSCALAGLDRTSVALMVGAFALAPSDRLVLPGLPFLGISDALFFLSLGLVVPRLLRTRLVLPTPFVWTSLVFTLFVVLSVLYAGDQAGAAAYYGARVIYTFIGVPILLVWWSPSFRVVVALATAFVVGNGVSVVVGYPDIGAYRNFGLTQHPNALGYTAVLSLALVPFLWKSIDPGRRIWICVPAVGGALVGILTSGSRAALVVAIILVILVPAVERSVVAALLVIGAGLMAIVLLPSQVTPNGEDALSRLLGAGDAAGSDALRVQGVEKSLPTALDHPLFGIGFSFINFEAHNVYVQVAVAVGFIGLFAFIGVSLSMLTTMFVHESPYSRLSFPVVVFLTAGPVSPNLTDRYIGVAIGLSLVAVVAIQSRQRGDADTELGASAHHRATRVT